MKIIQILPELNSGGVERGTIELAEYLVSKGHESVVISNGGRQVGALEQTGSRHISLPVHKKRLSSLFQVRPLRKILEQERPDILHIRSRVPGWIAWLAWRRMDPATRPRLVSTVHGFYSINRYSAIMCKGEQVIAVSESIRDYIFENYPETPEENVTVVYRGIDPDRYFPDFRPSQDWLQRWKEAYPQLEGKCIFLLPGRITRLKGHADFFDLLAGLQKDGRQVHGLVVGDTHPKKRAYLHELQQMVAGKGLNDVVTFTGHRSDVQEIMAVSDVVCALSQQPESFGRTVIEAMALGRPVLGYDCGGVGELLAAIFPSGRVALGDGEALLATAREILDSESLPKVPEGSFTLEAMCSKTLAVYKRLLE